LRSDGIAAGPLRRLFQRADIITGSAWLAAASARALQRILPGTARTPDGVVVACVSCPGELWQNSQFWRLAGQVS
jgi:hypothetical protein